MKKYLLLFIIIFIIFVGGLFLIIDNQTPPILFESVANNKQTETKSTYNTVTLENVSFNYPNSIFTKTTKQCDVIADKEIYTDPDAIFLEHTLPFEWQNQIGNKEYMLTDISFHICQLDTPYTTFFHPSDFFSEPVLTAINKYPAYRIDMGVEGTHGTLYYIGINESQTMYVERFYITEFFDIRLPVNGFIQSEEQQRITEELLNSITTKG